MLFFTFVIAFPFLLLALLELALRLFHYGPDISLFTTEMIGGRTYSIMNHDVKHRYFSRVAFSPNTSPDYFLNPKPPGTYRIFCLGGSTTVGFPYSYVGSFSTFLRDRLHAIFPEKNIEIINLGMTATNSFTVLDIAREVVDLQPDLFIVYDGHNEFYGALGIASHESLGGSRWLTLAYLRLIHIKAFILLRNTFTTVAGFFKPASTPEEGGTMMERLARGQYIPYASTTYQNALKIFKANMLELTEICSSHNISLILTSQVSNVRDQPPFVSEENSTITLDRLSTFNTAFNAGLTLWMEGHPDSALEQFYKSAAIDSLRADVHYQIARCLGSLGQETNARREYIAARDYDKLRFRASSDFNTAILGMNNNDRTVAVDMEAAFMHEAPDSTIGNDLILEHLHPNARGYFTIAKEYARAMREHQFLASTEEWQSRDTISDATLWQHQPMTELDERYAQRRIDILTSGWPFKPQSSHQHAIPEGDTLGRIVEQVVDARLTWEQGHVAAAEHYERRGDLEKAEKEYQAVMNQVPLNVSSYFRLSHLYIQQSRIDDARRVLLESLKIERSAFASRALGGIELNSGNPAEAVPYLAQAFALSEGVDERSDAGFFYALALTRAGKPELAVTPLQQVLAINPKFKPARDLLRKIGSK